MIRPLVIIHGDWNWVRESRSITFTIGPRKRIVDGIVVKKRDFEFLKQNLLQDLPLFFSSSISFLRSREICASTLNRVAVYMYIYIYGSVRRIDICLCTPLIDRRLIGSKHGKAWLYYADKGRRPTKSTERIHSFFIRATTTSNDNDESRN